MSYPDFTNLLSTSVEAGNFRLIAKTSDDPIWQWRDFADVYGVVLWRPYGAPRPESFNENAGILLSENGESLWLQPPEDTTFDDVADRARALYYDGCFTLTVSLLQYLQTANGEQWHTIDSNSLWGIESSSGKPYVDELLTDLASALWDAYHLSLDD